MSIDDDSDSKYTPTSGAPRLDIDHIVVEGTAAGLSQEEIASQAGCSPRTVARRQHEVDIRQRISERRAQLTSEIAGRLLSLGHLAVDVLGEGLTDGEARERRASATAVIDRALRVRRFGEVEDRLVVLEAALRPVEIDSSSEHVEEER